jgi:3,5-epimerase/4-reductase
MKYLIFGNGYIGNKFTGYLNDAVIAPTDIGNEREVREAIEKYKPEIVLNCAGKTGKPNIDWCEEHKVETVYSNVIGPLVLVKVCQEKGLYLVHVGSGCVYAGDNSGVGYSESDSPNFWGSFYSRTKIWSETVLSEFDHVLQLRLRMPIDSVPGPRNLINKLVSYRKVIDIPNSMSVLDDFLVGACFLMEHGKTGIYNMTNPGAMCHPEILDLYREIVDNTFTYTTISLDELSRVVKAPRSNCVLSTYKIERDGVPMRPLQDAVRQTLELYRVHWLKQQKPVQKEGIGCGCD